MLEIGIATSAKQDEILSKVQPKVLSIISAFSRTTSMSTVVCNITGKGKLKHAAINHPTATGIKSYLRVTIDDKVIYYASTSANSNNQVVGLINPILLTSKANDSGAANVLSGNITYFRPEGGHTASTNLPYTSGGTKIAFIFDGIHFNSNLKVEIISDQAIETYYGVNAEVYE